MCFELPFVAVGDVVEAVCVARSDWLEPWEIDPWIAD